MFGCIWWISNYVVYMGLDCCILLKLIIIWGGCGVVLLMNLCNWCIYKKGCKLYMLVEKFFNFS